MAGNRAQRNRRYREGIARRGDTNFAALVDKATADRLRVLAREHGQTVGQVLRVASVLLERRLAEAPTRGSAE